VSNGQPLVDYTNKDYASLRAALLQVAADRFPEWTDQSPNDLGTMLLELFAYMGDALFYNQDRIAGESFLETAVERRSVVQLLRLIGYELRPPAAASADLTLLFKDTTYDPTVSFSVPQFAAFKTTVPATGTPITFQYIQTASLAIDRGSLPFGYTDAQGKLQVDSAGKAVAPPTPLPTNATRYRVYQTLPVVQVDANIASEIVASSDGSAGQRYALSRSPVVAGTLVVSVDAGGGPVVWNLVPSLLESQAGDTSYAVRRDENNVVWIEFGDGTYGKVPQRGLNNITASYSVGGGVKGNVPANAISKLVTAIDQLKGVVNVLPASGGAEAEATQDAAARGPAQFRATGRAVTASDYETLAKAFGVAKALAQPVGWNTVQLVVAPAGGGVPSQTLIDDLTAFLEPKRMLTTLLQIAGPRYVNVYVDVTVAPLPQFSTTLVRQQVVTVVNAYFSFDGLGFNQILYISKLYEVIQEIDGVAGVRISTFARDAYVANSLPPSGQLTFGTAVDATGDSTELPQWAGFDGATSTLTMGPLNG
jgi:hypothetical protein